MYLILMILMNGEALHSMFLKSIIWIILAMREEMYFID